MAEKSYDTILTRLMLTLTKLSGGERPTLKELAEEFNVSLKTVQRDIYHRLMLFPIEKTPEGELVFMDGFTLSKTQLSMDEIITMSLSLDLIKGAGSEFNKSARHLFAKMLHSNFCNPYYIKPPQHQMINMDSDLMNTIEKSIETQTRALITTKEETIEVEPYKITNIEGIWYLLAYDMDKAKVKTYLVANIVSFKKTRQTFTPRHDIAKLLPKVQSAFFDSGRSFDVIIAVYPNVAEYFKLKRLLPSQEILEEKTDGTLIIKYAVSHEEDIDNLIKAWLPDIEVLEPAAFRDQIVHELQAYLERLQT